MKPGLLARLRPRHLSAAIAILGLGWALAYAVSQEPPVGRLDGRVVEQGMRTPIAGALVVLAPVDAAPEAKRALRYTRTREDGRFSFAHVVAGGYEVSAVLDAYSVEYSEVTVHEGRTASVTLAVSLSRPQLQLAGPARYFTTAEEVSLRVRGYVDGRQVAGQPTIRVRTYRTRMSGLLSDAATAKALSHMGAGWGLASGIPDVLLRPPAADPPGLLWEREFPITEAGTGGFYTKTIEFGRQEVGLYLVEARYADTTVSTWLLVSDTALVIKSAPGKILAYVADAHSGVPVPGSPVRLHQKGQVLAQARTDRDGIARFSLPEATSDFFLMAVAQRGSDEAVVGRTDYRFEQSGEFTVHAYTDRPVYRPGHRIHYKAIVRRNTQQGFDYTVPAGQSVTVEVRDPAGEPVYRAQHRASAYGSLAGQFDLSPEAPTGTYELLLSAGETTSTNGIVVASYRKPEFSVTVAPEKTRYNRGEPIRMTVSARFYHGAPVAGGKVTYYAYRTADWMAAFLDQYGDQYGYDAEDMEEWSGWYAGDGAAVTEGEARLDEDGKAVITFRANVPDEADEPQDHQFIVQAAVEDASGREVFAEGTARVSAGDLRLAVLTDGYLASPRTPMQVVLTARDHERNPVAGVPVELQAAYTRWEPTAQQYVDTRLDTQTATSGPDGRAVVTVTFPRTGYVRLTALATDAGGRKIRARESVWVAGEGEADLGVRYTELSLLTDRRRYQPGDVARVLINTSGVGQTVLLTIEGSTIYQAIAVPIRERSTVVNVPIQREYGPNVFLGALYVKEKRTATSQAALRVTIPDKELQVTIRPDRPRYGPGERITYHIDIRDASGNPKQAEFSLGVVDESIYALLEDDPRALRDAFYPRRWNMVRTSFSFALLYLGDADKAEPTISPRTRFLDTAYWQPMLKTNAQGTATVSFVLPDNLTTWRATVNAHTKDTRLGRTINKVTASKEFFVRLETPRLLTQHDRSRVLVLVHNETDAPQRATVRMRVQGLALEGPDTQTVILSPSKVEQIAWPVTARQPGTARIQATAWTAGQDRTRLTDGVEISLPVEPYGRLRSAAAAGEITAGRPKTELLEMDPQAIPGTTRLTVRITPSVLTSMLGGLEYLIGYPYGCVEQTMSRFVPTLLVQRALRAAGVPHPDLEARIPAMVRDGLARLYRFQHESGGWGWWEFDDDDPWMTAYVLYGLATGRSQGFEVSETVLKRGLDAALEMADAASPDTRAFLLYAAALAGDPEAVRGRLSGVQLRDLGPDGLAYLVLLNRLLRQDAAPAFAELGRRAIARDGTVHWETAQAGRAPQDLWNWDDRMATATALRAILAVDRRDSRVGGILRWMMMSRTEHYWWSTRTTSWILAALADYAAAERGAKPPAGAIRISLNGHIVQTIGLTPDLLRPADTVVALPVSALRPGRNDLTLEQAGGPGRVFYSVQFRQTVAMDEIPAVGSAGLRVVREYLRVRPERTGRDTWSLQARPSGNQFEQGDRVMVRLTITTAEDLAYVVIEDPYPAGLEVTQRGSAEIDEWKYWWTGTDVRDDRIAFFARSVPAGQHVIEYHLRAQTPGTYNALPALLYGMYAPQTRAESSGLRVVVR